MAVRSQGTRTSTKRAKPAPRAKSSVAKSSVAKSSVAKSSVAKSSVAKSSVAKSNIQGAKPAPRATTRSKPTKPAAAPRALSTTTESSASAEFAGYSPRAVEFLIELRANNDRAWFKEHQARYEADVREPTLALIRALAPRLREISQHLVASDKRVGGSLMRIQRDTRFAHDASPYKTNVGVHFRHAAGKDVHAPGLYFHVDPDSVFVGAGIWHPDAPALAKLRRHIDEHPARWQRVSDEVGFRTHFKPSGESLQRPPKGFASDHPLLELLRRKDHIYVAELAHDELYRASLVTELLRRFDASRAFMQLLHDALGLAF